ncbi:hypothetical protein [Nocardia neocaledoniensis]|uniref:hypothetical protein n=1 Tax=Nocardia neocaledoniensis TaxID=236511 RepID=UPI003CC7D351
MEITYQGAGHVGRAVDTELGLLAPVIHTPRDLSLAGGSRFGGAARAPAPPGPRSGPTPHCGR